jgi:hypothetical protein
VTVLALLVISAKCEKFKWTIVYFVNLTSHTLYATTEGIDPDPCPGVVNPGAGTTQLSANGAQFYGPVAIDDTITMLWTVVGNSTTNKAEFKRDDLGMPAKVNGGKITFTFTSNCTWQITYIPWSPEMEEDDEDDDSGE